MMHEFVLHFQCIKSLVFPMCECSYLCILSLLINVFISVKPIVSPSFYLYQFLFLRLHFKTSDSYSRLYTVLNVSHYTVYCIDVFLLLCVVKNTIFSTKKITVACSKML